MSYTQEEQKRPAFTLSSDHEGVKQPPISAVQMSAAITAYARIHMYPYISRPDCVYTDTYFAILANPLPAEEVSSTELGKMKLECKVKTGVFLAES